jgi:hypothetical protein
MAGQDREQLVGYGESNDQEGEEEGQRRYYRCRRSSCIVWDALIAVVQRNHGEDGRFGSRLMWETSLLPARSSCVAHTSMDSARD